MNTFIDLRHLEVSRIAALHLPPFQAPPLRLSAPRQARRSSRRIAPSASSSWSRGGRRRRRRGTSGASSPCGSSGARSGGRTKRTSTGTPRTWQQSAKVGFIQSNERQRHSLVRFLSRVHPGVPREVAREPELLVAVLAGQRLLRCVDLGMLVQVLRVGKSLSAVAALLRGLKGTEKNHLSKQGRHL